MKLFFLLSILHLTPSALASTQPMKLTADNLALLTLKNSNKEVFDQRVMHRVKSEDSSKYYKVRKNPEKLKALVENTQKQVNKRLTTIDKHQTFTLEQTVSFLSYDESRSILRLENFINDNGYKSLVRKPAVNDGLPNRYLALIANMDLLNKISYDTKAFNRVLSAKETNKKLNTKLHMQATLKVVEFQNGNNFQMIVTSLKLYATKNKKILIGSIEEKREPQTLINNWLLSGGISNKLVNIHGFMFFGHRLQETIPKLSEYSIYCKKTIQIKAHQVLVCQRPYSENSAIIITYIGGIIAQIDLVTTGKLQHSEKKTISKHFMTQLQKPKSIFNKKLEKWTKYDVDFIFYSDAFFNKKSPESNYKFYYNSKDGAEPSSFTTIATMMSHATKKLIEDNR